MTKVNVLHFDLLLTCLYIITSLTYFVHRLWPLISGK